MRDISCVDWKNAYDGVAIITEELKTVRVRSLSTPEGRQWFLSGKNLVICSPTLMMATVNDQSLHIAVEDYEEEDRTGTRYVVSRDDLEIAVLPTYIWQILEGRTRGRMDGEHAVPNDKYGLFAAAFALAQKVNKPNSSWGRTWLGEGDISMTRSYLRDVINEIGRAIEEVRHPAHLAADVLFQLNWE
jgi:hypothetical protein